MLGEGEAPPSSPALVDSNASGHGRAEVGRALSDQSRPPAMHLLALARRTVGRVLDLSSKLVLAGGCLSCTLMAFWEMRVNLALERQLPCHALRVSHFQLCVVLAAVRGERE